MVEANRDQFEDIVDGKSVTPFTVDLTHLYLLQAMASTSPVKMSKTSS